MNPKIEKVNIAIEKAKAQIVEYQSKLRDLEKQKIQLENEEIVAMFRREKLNEDEFAALLQSGRKKTGRVSQQNQHVTLQNPQIFLQNPKEEVTDVDFEA